MILSKLIVYNLENVNCLSTARLTYSAVLTLLVSLLSLVVVRLWEFLRNSNKFNMF